MSKLVVAGGARLKGEIAIEGSKNAVCLYWPHLCLTAESIIKNCPKLRDVEVMIEILKS